MPDDRQKGIACIVVSAFGFALMAFFVRLCDDFGAPIGCVQKSFFRNVIALVIAGWVFVAQSRRAGPDARKRPGITGRVALNLVLRSVFGCVGIFANFYALSKIPIGEAMTLNKTAPFFTVAFSWLLFGERVRPRQAVWLVVAFAGALLVIRPGFRTDDLFAALCALTGGLGAGLAYVCVHALGRMKVNGPLIVLFFSAFSCLVSLPFLVFDCHPMTFAQLAILIGAGAGAAIGQFGITAAYRFAEPRSISVFDYTNVIFTGLLGFLFLGQTPDVLAAAGFATILFAAIGMRRSD